MCILIYALGIILVVIFQEYLYSLGFFFIATLFVIPTLIELKKEYNEFIKQYRKSRRKVKTVIIGGLPSVKKHTKETTTIKRSFFAPPEKAHAKGEVMQELGLFYDDKIQREQEEEKENTTKPKEGISAKEQKEAFFKDLFDALEEKRRINITYQTHYKGYRGKDILKEVKHLVKLLGKEGEIEVIEKGKGGVIVKKQYLFKSEGTNNNW